MIALLSSILFPILALVVASQDVSTLTSEEFLNSSENDTMTNSSIAEYSAPRLLILTVTTLRLAITVAGLIANFMVCVAILKFRYLQNVGNYFVFNLALVDLLSALFDLSQIGVNFQQGFPKVLGFLKPEVIPCDVEMIGNTLTSISVFFLVAISTDRFIFIEYPLKYHGCIQSTYKVQIAVIWIGTTVVWSFMNFQMICGGFNGQPGDYAMQYQVFTIILFATCFVLMAVQYARILATARRQYIRSKQMTVVYASVARSNNEDNSNNKASGGTSEIPVKMIVGFVIIVGMACLTFVVFPTPFYLFLIFGFHQDTTWVRHMSVLKQITGLQFTLNTSCNPFIYALTQKKYRDAFCELLKSLFVRKNDDAGRLDLVDQHDTVCGCFKVPTRRSVTTTTAGNFTYDETCT